MRRTPTLWFPLLLSRTLAHFCPLVQYPHADPSRKLGAALSASQFVPCNMRNVLQVGSVFLALSTAGCPPTTLGTNPPPLSPPPPIKSLAPPPTANARPAHS